MRGAQRHVSTSTPGVIYEESVRTPRSMLLAGLLVALGLLGTAAATLADADATPASKVRDALLQVALAAVVFALVSVFRVLRIVVDGRSLRFHFGPLGKTLDAAAIASARVERYDWWRFGGWGLRLSMRRPLREIAYSVPFLRDGVGVDTSTGKHYHISSERPEQLAGALAALAARDEGAR